MATNPNPVTGLPLSGGTVAGSVTLTSPGFLTCNGIQSNSQVQLFNGSTFVSTAGFGYGTKEGANCKQGTFTLGGTATTTVANTSVTANSRILLTCQALGTVTAASTLAVSARVAGTSFTVTPSQSTDTSTIAFEIFEPG